MQEENFEKGQCGFFITVMYKVMRLWANSNSSLNPQSKPLHHNPQSVWALRTKCSGISFDLEIGHPISAFKSSGCGGQHFAIAVSSLSIKNKERRIRNELLT